MRQDGRKGVRHEHEGSSVPTYCHCRVAPVDTPLAKKVLQSGETITREEYHRREQDEG